MRLDGVLTVEFYEEVEGEIHVAYRTDEKGVSWVDLTWEGLPAQNQTTQCVWFSCPASYAWQQVFTWLRTNTGEVVTFVFTPSQGTREFLVVLSTQ